MSAKCRYCCKGLFGERKFLGLLMRFRRGDVRETISFHPKSTTDLPSGAEKRRSGRDVQKSTFARFLGLIDFRLLQQYLPETDLQQWIAEYVCNRLIVLERVFYG